MARIAFIWLLCISYDALSLESLEQQEIVVAPFGRINRN